jgi:glycosyltransferase involved in cell wall biosynthesis
VISVVVPAFNEEKLLPATLAALREALACVERSEVIVVDNASTDRTAAIAAEAGARVEPKFITSARRWNHMGLVRMLFFTHPITIFLAWRRPKFWKDWYERAIR